MRGLFKSLHDQIDQLILDHDGLADLAALLCQEGSDLLVGQNIGNNSIIVQICFHHDSAAHLSVDLNRNGDLRVLALGLVIGGPGFIGNGVVMTQDLPQFFAHMGDGSEALTHSVKAASYASS